MEMDMFICYWEDQKPVMLVKELERRTKIKWSTKYTKIS
jgi:hypothetical protein